jgi:hypothetical protein
MTTLDLNLMGVTGEKSIFYPNGAISNTEQILYKIVSSKQKWPMPK